MSASPALPPAATGGGPAPVDRLAGFCAALRFEELPASLVEKAKVHVLDTLGAALAGTLSDEFATVADLSGERPGGALIWGTPRRTSPREAALANGVAAHVFELDDTGGCDHSGAVVLPAAIAALASSEAPVPGRDLVAAVVAGYEAGRRVLEAAGGYDVHNGAGWHSTGTCGTMAAAAAVARLRGFGPSAMRDAITLATSFSGGLWAFIHDGSQAKKIHAGRAAEGGLLAAGLAAGGFRGPSRVFDDVWGGFFRSFNGTPGDPSRLDAGLGEVWKLDRVSLKPYASCRGAHSSVDALFDILAGTGRTAAGIESLEVVLSEMLLGMCGRADLDPLAAAQMSLPYALAAAAVFGDAGLAAYAGARRRDPRIAAMLARIRLSPDPAMPAMDEPVLRIRFRDGTEAERMVPHPTGSQERPMAPGNAEAKFMELGGLALEAPAARALRDAVMELERLEDCRGLERLLLRDGPPPPRFR